MGEAGDDTLFGGAHNDTFRFATLQDSSVELDTIVDFNPAEGDRIDLSLIDANTLLAGDQAFTLVTSGFTGGAGQLAFDNAYNGFIMLHGDVNGDGIPDLNIMLGGYQTLVATNFYL